MDKSSTEWLIFLSRCALLSKQKMNKLSAKMNSFLFIITFTQFIIFFIKGNRNI